MSNEGFIRRKHYLYHVTAPENVPLIKKEGLIRKNGFAVYLSEDPYSWWRPGLAIIKVRITGLKGLKTFLPEMDEILCFEDISPLRIYSEVIPKKSAYKKYKQLQDHMKEDEDGENTDAPQ